METNPCDMNQLDSDSHLPPRKRLLAGFKKLNSNGDGSFPSDFASSSSTSNSNGSSSASTHVQTHLDNLLSSRFNNDQSPEELVEATRSAAALAVKAAKAARAIANEKALISAKAIAAAKRALELVDSFPKEAMADCKERSPKKNKQKKHVPVELLYSKGQLRDEDDDLARRLHRAIGNTYPRVLRTCSGFEENGQRYKKQKKNKTVVEGGSSSIVVTGSMNDIAGVVDSDSSYEGLEIARSNRNEVDSRLMMEKAGEENNSLVKRRGRVVKLKKLPLSICNSRNQENGTSSASPLPVAQPQEDSGAITVIPGSSSWKCQDLKAPECVKQNKAVRS